MITKLESAFLELMMQNENKVVTYDMIFDDLDQFDATFSTIKNLVYRLKTKYQFNFVKNIKDVGYILVKDD
ncbi:MAG: helix-turn-helix domain-containing protein [Campylobacterota bacterium]|nr:helix-turn-helix domain-containing protein [Campylobacterota bacterium]